MNMPDSPTKRLGSGNLRVDPRQALYTPLKNDNSMPENVYSIYFSLSLCIAYEHFVYMF